MTKAKVSLLEDSSVRMGAKYAEAKINASSWRKKYEDSLKEYADLEKKVSFLESIGPRSRYTIKALSPLVGSKPEGVAVIVPANDWHVEEKIFSYATNGKNQFDLPEAERRIKRFYGKVLELIDWQNHLAPVTEIWHPLLGDLLTGYIHEELVESNSLSPTEACVFLQDVICSGMDL